MRLFGEPEAAPDRPRVVAEEQADEVLLLRDLPLERRDLTGGAVDELFGLAHVDERRRAALLPHLGEAQRFLPRRERAPREVELGIGR